MQARAQVQLLPAASRPGKTVRSCVKRAVLATSMRFTYGPIQVLRDARTA